MTDMRNPFGYNFDSIDDFKWCMKRGGEAVFEWNGKEFGVFGGLQKGADSPIQIFIGPSDETNKRYPNEYPELWCDTPDEALEYKIDNQPLRDIITQVTVIDRPL